MTDNIDFWSLVIGIVGMAVICGGLYGFIELADARQNARYHRAQRDRINSRLGVFHEGGQ